MDLANPRRLQCSLRCSRGGVGAIVLFAASVLSSCTSQKGTEWDALNTQMLAQFNSADYDACLHTGAKALAIAEAENDPKQHDIITTLNLFAVCHQNKGELAQARTLLERARGIVDKVGNDAEHDYAVKTYNNLATLTWAEGDLVETEALLKENVARTGKLFSPNSEAVAMAKANLGGLYEQQEKYDEAQPLLEAALASYANAYGKKWPGVVRYQDALATFYVKRGKFDEAQRLFESSLEIEREGGSRLDSMRALTLASLAELHVAKGDLANAEATYRSALDLAEKRYPSASFIATTSGELAAVYSERGKDAEAESLFRKAIATEEKAIGRDASHLKQDMEGLAKVFDRVGKGDEAKGLRERVAAMGPRIN